MVGFLLPTEGKIAQHLSILSLVNVPSAQGAHATPSQVGPSVLRARGSPLLVQVL